MTWQAKENQRRMLMRASELTRCHPEIYAKHVEDEKNRELLRKLQPDDFDPAALSRSQSDALEAIILEVGRPVFLVQDGAVEEPEEAIWRRRISDNSRSIERNIRSVGRIEIDIDTSIFNVIGESSDRLVGTGFVVGPNLVLTNRHVAKLFCRTDGSVRTGFNASIDFVEEHGRDPDIGFRILRAVEIAADDDFDYALLEIEGGSAFPPALDLIDSAFDLDIDSDPLVYVVGYPAFDTRNPTDVQNRIFKGIFDVKRFAPGRLREVDRTPLGDAVRIQGDYQSLGGNSGSGVFDLETGRVVALHFAGVYGGANFSVPIWRLVDRIRAAARAVGEGSNLAPRRAAERGGQIAAAVQAGAPDVLGVFRQTLGLFERLLDTGGAPPPFEAPGGGAPVVADPVRQIIELIRSRSGVTVTPDTPLQVVFTTRASLASFLVNHVNPRFGVPVHQDELWPNGTVRDLANLIAART